MFITMYHINIIFFTLLALIPINESLKILVYFPMPSKSHSILGQGVVTHLLNAGHEVVHVTSFPREKPVANLREICTWPLAEEKLNQNPDFLETVKLRNQIKNGNFGDTLMFLFFTNYMNSQILEYDEVAKLLSDPREKFDVVIAEWFFSDFIAGIAPLLECPLVWFCSTEAHWEILKIIDEIPNPAYTVNLFSESYTPLSFWERTLELWAIIRRYTVWNLLLMPYEKSAYNKIFPKLAEKRGVKMPPYNEAIYNSSFTFLNSHPSLGTPYRLPQNTKYIAGFHIDDKVKPLPQHLQKLMDEAEHGVIYFSLGSNLKSKDMSDDMRDSFLKVFGSLKQIVIWKFEAEAESVPQNVHLVEWTPQQSILAHPNLKLFITHGGQLSTTEAVHYAVPVVGIPVMADQHLNMKTVVGKGLGVSVKITDDDVAAQLRDAIREVLSKDLYRQRAKELSWIYHDRPAAPGAELVHWVRHAVRTRGAAHLRSPALAAPLYQKMYLDLAALVLAISIVFIKLTKKIMPKFIKMIAKKSSNKEKIK